MLLCAETGSLKPARLDQGDSYGEIPLSSPGKGPLLIQQL